MHGEWIATDCTWSSCQQPALPGFLVRRVHDTSPCCSLQREQKAEDSGLSSWRPASQCPAPLLFQVAPGRQLWSSASARLMLCFCTYSAWYSRHLPHGCACSVLKKYEQSFKTVFLFSEKDVRNCCNSNDLTSYSNTAYGLAVWY